MLQGYLEKMGVSPSDPVNYELVLSDERVALNPFLGKRVRLEFLKNIHCVACGREVKKSFNQGYCFPCSQSLAACDICILKPEKCHFDQGTCREPDWAQTHCMQPHYVYLANSSGLKVGITRETQIPTRWLDQGATQALKIFKTQNRFQVGLVEVLIKAFVADKTDWRKMLKGAAVEMDLYQQRDAVFEKCGDGIAGLRQRFGEQSISYIDDDQISAFNYPVLHYPEKVVSHDLDKNPVVESRLLGIKGQYLILENSVINLRKYSGYKISFSTNL